MSARIATIVAVPLFAAALVTGCAESSSQVSNGTSGSVLLTADSGGEPSVSLGPAATTTTMHRSAPTTRPDVPSPVPATTTPTASTGGVVTLAPLDPLPLVPHVDTLIGTTHFSCAQAAAAAYATRVTWSATSSVVLAIDNVPIGHAPSSDFWWVPLTCGDSQTVTVTALWPDNTPGRSRTIVIQVDPA